MVQYTYNTGSPLRILIGDMIDEKYKNKRCQLKKYGTAQDAAKKTSYFSITFLWQFLFFY